MLRMEAAKKLKNIEAEQEQLSLFAFAGADENGYTEAIVTARQPQCDLDLARIARAGLPALHEELMNSVAKHLRGCSIPGKLRDEAIGIYGTVMSVLGVVRAAIPLPETRDALVFEMHEFGFKPQVISPLIPLSFGNLKLADELENAYTADVYAYLCAAELLSRVVAYALDGRSFDDLLG